jgi:hypothetical protein
MFFHLGIIRVGAGDYEKKEREPDNNEKNSGISGRFYPQFTTSPLI